MLIQKRRFVCFFSLKQLLNEEIVLSSILFKYVLINSAIKNVNNWSPEPNTNCGLVTKNEIAILISNSDLHHHVLQPHQGSPCKEHFEGRLAIGTHATDWSDLTEFSSEHFKSFYVSS